MQSTILHLWWLKLFHCPMPSRSTGDQDSPAMLHAKVNRTPKEVPAGTEANDPAGLPLDSHATATAKAVAPPIGHPTAQAVAHHPASLTDPIARKPPTGTPRTLINVIFSNSVVTMDQQLQLTQYSLQLFKLLGNCYKPKVAVVIIHILKCVDDI